MESLRKLGLDRPAPRRDNERHGTTLQTANRMPPDARLHGSSFLCSHISRPHRVDRAVCCGRVYRRPGPQLADALAQSWGEPVLVINKAGAASRIGTRHVIEQRSADGRTLLLGSLGFFTAWASSPRSFHPAAHRSIPRHWHRSFISGARPACFTSARPCP